MAFCIKDAATDKLVRELAKRKGKTLTEAVREAAQNELAKCAQSKSVGEALDELTKQFAKVPRSGKKADKAYFDKMWGNE